LVTNLLPREAPCGFSSRHNVSASLLSLSRYAVYKVESFVYFRRTTRSPLTLDCFVRTCVFERCTQDTLSRRRFLFGCQRADPRSVNFRQGSRRRGRILSRPVPFVKSLTARLGGA